MDSATGHQDSSNNEGTKISDQVRGSNVSSKNGSSSVNTSKSEQSLLLATDKPKKRTITVKRKAIRLTETAESAIRVGPSTTIETVDNGEGLEAKRRKLNVISTSSPYTDATTVTSEMIERQSNSPTQVSAPSVLHHSSSQNKSTVTTTSRNHVTNSQSEHNSRSKNSSNIDSTCLEKSVPFNVNHSRGSSERSGPGITARDSTNSISRTAQGGVSTTVDPSTAKGSLNSVSTKITGGGVLKVKRPSFSKRGGREVAKKDKEIDNVSTIDKKQDHTSLSELNDVDITSSRSPTPPVRSEQRKMSLAEMKAEMYVWE